MKSISYNHIHTPKLHYSPLKQLRERGHKNHFIQSQFFFFTWHDKQQFFWTHKSTYCIIETLQSTLIQNEDNSCIRIDFPV